MLVKNPAGRVIEIAESEWEDAKARGCEMIEPAVVFDEVMGRPTLSVIVLAWNRLDQTKKCIASILGTTRLDFELIVVDNASNDGTPEYLADIAKTDARVRIITNKENRGVAGGRNDGIREARGRFLAFFDNDSTVGSGWDRIMLDVFTRRVHAGFVGRNGTNMQTFTQRGMRAVTLLTDREVRCDIVSGGATMVRREVFEECGLLDEWGMGEFWHEDMEICLRAARAGWESYAVVYPWDHKAHSSYREEKGAQWMEAFDKNLEYIKNKLNRGNEVTILLNRDTYERDLYRYGREFFDYLTRRGCVARISYMPPIVPASVRRAAAFGIETSSDRFLFMGYKNSIAPWSWPAYFKAEKTIILSARPVTQDMGELAYPCHVGPDKDIFNASVRPTSLLPPAAFVFMHRGSSKAQGTDLAVRAYLEEFSGEDTILVLKPDIISDIRLLQLVDEVRKATGSKARIIFEDAAEDDRRVAAFLRRANAVLMPSRAASEPLRAHEAHACGSRIIGTPVGALGGLIDAPVSGQWVPSTYLNNPVEPFYTTEEWPEWVEADVKELRGAMRRAYAGEIEGVVAPHLDRETTFDILRGIIKR